MEKGADPGRVASPDDCEKIIHRPRISRVAAATPAGQRARWVRKQSCRTSNYVIRGLEPISKNIYEKVSYSLPPDSTFVTSAPDIRVTSRVNDLTCARSCARLVRQPCCRTSNAAPRTRQADKAPNPTCDSTGDGRHPSSFPYRQTESKIEPFSKNIYYEGISFIFHVRDERTRHPRDQPGQRRDMRQIVSTTGAAAMLPHSKRRYTRMMSAQGNQCSA